MKKYLKVYLIIVCMALGYSCEQNAVWKWVDGPQSGKIKTDKANNLIPKQEGDKWGYVNKYGDWIVSPKHPKVENFSFGVGKAFLMDEYFVYYDVNGKAFVQPELSMSGFLSGGEMSINGVSGYSCNGIKLKNIGDFSEGYAAALLNGKWGYIDRTGTWAVEPQFERAGNFKDGVAKVTLAGKEGYIALKRSKY
jgi:hypothetical protein